MMKRLCLMIILLLLWDWGWSAESQADTADPNQVYAGLMEEAQQGDVGAQLLLGYLYANGQDVPKDLTKAVHWYTLAAKQRDADAQVTLALMYMEGQGVEKDHGMACEWLDRAEQNGKDVSALKARLLPPRSDPGAGTQQGLPRKDAQQTTAIVHVMEIESAPARYVFESDGFSGVFHAKPKRTLIKDDETGSAVAYQALSPDGLVQYNVIFQYFSDPSILHEESGGKFFREYLAGRARFALNHAIRKKDMRFCGFPAVSFKHATFAEGIHRIHEGILVLADGRSVSLTCVYHPSAHLVLPFEQFCDSFQWIPAESAEQP